MSILNRITRIPENALFQYLHPVLKIWIVYDKNGIVLGSTSNAKTASLPIAVGQVYNPKTFLWTAKLDNGLFIDGKNIGERFDYLVGMPKFD